MYSNHIVRFSDALMSFPLHGAFCLQYALIRHRFGCEKFRTVIKHNINPVSYTHLDVYKRQFRNLLRMFKKP